MPSLSERPDSEFSKDADTLETRRQSATFSWTDPNAENSVKVLIGQASELFFQIRYDAGSRRSVNFTS